MLSDEYQGWTIDYDDRSDQFVAKPSGKAKKVWGSVELRDMSIKNLKHRIVAFKRRKMPRKSCIYETGREFVPAMITAVIGKYSWNNAVRVRVSYKNTNSFGSIQNFRDETSIDDLLLNTKKNRLLTKRIMKLRALTKKLEGRLKRFPSNKFLKYAKGLD